jgi:hypothetical protein
LYCDRNCWESVVGWWECGWPWSWLGEIEVLALLHFRCTNMISAWCSILPLTNMASISRTGGSRTDSGVISCLVFWRFLPGIVASKCIKAELWFQFMQ